MTDIGTQSLPLFDLPSICSTPVQDSQDLDTNPCGDLAGRGVTRAPEYDAAFFRQSGWTGADGTYSLTLSDGSTVWFFSDTLLGEVSADGEREVHGASIDATAPVFLINNSIAVQKGPTPAGLSFRMGQQNGAPASLFSPRESGEWLWVNAGTVNPDHSISVLLNAFRAAPGEQSMFGRQTGLWTADVRLSAGRLSVTDCERVHFTEDAMPGTHDSSVETVWGAAALDDGLHTYIYGSQITTESSVPQRGLVVARAPRGELHKGRLWRFYNGSNFTKNSRHARRLPLAVPNEFSVQRLGTGRYLMVLSECPGSVSLSFADAPEGPWSQPELIWSAPESTNTIYSYHAKAHPGVSDERGLLVSYNVNSFDTYESLIQADVYRPRFIRVPWSVIAQLDALARFAPERSDEGVKAA